MPRFELSGPETRGGSRGGSSQERQVWTRAAAQAWGWAGLQAVCGERAIRGTRLHLQKQHLAVAPEQSQTGHGTQSREGAPLKAQGCLGDRACPTWGARGLPPVLKGDGAWGRSLGGRRAWAPPGQRQGAQSTQLVVGGGRVLGSEGSCTDRLGLDGHRRHSGCGLQSRRGCGQCALDSGQHLDFGRRCDQRSGSPEGPESTVAKRLSRLRRVPEVLVPDPTGSRQGPAVGFRGPCRGAARKSRELSPPTSGLLEVDGVRSPAHKRLQVLPVNPVPQPAATAWISVASSMPGGRAPPWRHV